MSENSTPSQSVIDAANQLVRVNDSRGRSIAIKKLSPIDRMRLFKVVGSENVKNEFYFGYAMLACSVVSVDGTPVLRPSNEPTLEALVTLLGDEGLDAVGKGIAENFVDKSVLPSEASDELKNG